VIEIKIAIVLGTRPEIIRLSPIIRYLEKSGKDIGVEFFVIHSGQHYDYEMDSIFFKDLELPEPKHNLGVGSESHAKQTNKISVLIEDILKEEQPDATIVYGDTNTTLAGAITSAKLKIPVVHIEAGCRSFDMNMPEEINRIAATHISRLLFPPDETSRQNLIKEGIAPDKIYLIGNTHVDACLENYEIAKTKSNTLTDLNIGGEYAVLTLHRQENVDVKDRLERMLEAVADVGIPVIFPMHPRTKKMVEQFGLEHLLKKLIVTKPLGYLDFLAYVGGAKVVFTDSGGIQVESNVLGVPCIVLRDTTEWVEEMGGMSFLVSDKKDLIMKAFEGVKNGDYKKLDYSKHKGSSKRIIDTIVELHKKDPLKMWKVTMVE